MSAPSQGHFVAGAPGVITDNIAQDKGLVNGTRCILHSLTLHESSPGTPVDNLPAMMQKPGPGGVVTLSKQPLSINVTPIVASKRFEERLLSDALRRSSQIIAAGKQIHSHAATCSKLPQGEYGCRMAVWPRPVRDTLGAQGG